MQSKLNTGKKTEQQEKTPNTYQQEDKVQQQQQQSTSNRNQNWKQNQNYHQSQNHNPNQAQNQNQKQKQIQNQYHNQNQNQNQSRYYNRNQNQNQSQKQNQNQSQSQCRNQNQNQSQSQNQSQNRNQNQNQIQNQNQSQNQIQNHNQSQSRNQNQSRNYNLNHNQNQNPHWRRKAFGSKLTNQPQPNSNLPAINSEIENNTDLSSLSLAQRLIQELSTSKYDCSICITPIKPHHPIYHCPNCFAIFHLNCSSKWASCSIADSSAKAILLRDRDQIPSTQDSIKGEWRCPGCQHPHIGTESIPNKYTCWCGKVLNLKNQFNENNPSHPHPPHHHHHHRRTRIPHSCGQRCTKISANGCVHSCMEICHPGSCSPCPAVIKTKCHCQKTQLSIRCSQLYTTRITATTTATPTPVEPTNYSEELSCDQVCNKILSCGIHSCQKTCHPGPCQECEVIRDKSCYCGRSKYLQQKCSNRIEFEDPILTIESQKNQHGRLVCVSSNDKSEWVGEFQCKARCELKYHCGIHTCNSTCHPHLDTQPIRCPYSPELINSCPCGATPLKNSSRKFCSDPIPTCQNICGKLLGSCGHPCQSICHLGPCSETLCETLVTTSCRCGKEKIVRQCQEIERLKKESLVENSLVQDANDRQEESLVLMKAIEFRCERRCRVLRNCGKHICNRTCCPLSFIEFLLYQKKSTHSVQKSQDSHLTHHDDPLGLHICNLVCNKKLSCGSHLCQLQDHKGPCPPCLLASFDPLICHCGLTVIEPPIRCGTRVNCKQTCRRGRPNPDCGHPIIPHQCHEEPDCPPCVYLTSKPCQCDKKNLVKNVRCSQPNNKVSCAQKCNNLLSCGAHRCQLICHPTGLCQTCDQVCLKPRKHCGHSCPEKCHAPTVCKTEAECHEMITIRCKCGHLDSNIKCSSCDDKPEGDRHRSLECTDECDLIRRNLMLMEALQVDKSKPSLFVVENSSSSNIIVGYSQNLLKVFKSHTGFAQTIESQLDSFLSSSFDVNTNSNSSFLIISTFSKLKQNFLTELISHYQIKFQPPLGSEPQFNVKLIKDSKSSKPEKLLSEVYKQSKNQMKEEEIQEEKNKKLENLINSSSSKRVIDPKRLKNFGNSDYRFSNSFNLLSSSNINGKINNKSTSAWFNSSPNHSQNSSQEIISGGFNKPPIAILAPMSSTSNNYTSNNDTNQSASYFVNHNLKDFKNRQDDLDVVDDWETQT